MDIKQTTEDDWDSKSNLELREAFKKEETKYFENRYFMNIYKERKSEDNKEIVEAISKLDPANIADIEECSKRFSIFKMLEVSLHYGSMETFNQICELAIKNSTCSKPKPAFYDDYFPERSDIKTLYELPPLDIDDEWDYLFNPFDWNDGVHKLSEKGKEDRITLHTKLRMLASKFYGMFNREMSFRIRGVFSDGYGEWDEFIALTSDLEIPEKRPIISHTAAHFFHTSSLKYGIERLKITGKNVDVREVYSPLMFQLLSSDKSDAEIKEFLKLMNDLSESNTPSVPGKLEDYYFPTGLKKKNIYQTDLFEHCIRLPTTPVYSSPIDYDSDKKLCFERLKFVMSLPSFNIDKFLDNQIPDINLLSYIHKEHPTTNISSLFYVSVYTEDYECIRYIIDVFGYKPNKTDFLNFIWSEEVSDMLCRIKDSKIVEMFEKMIKEFPNIEPWLTKILKATIAESDYLAEIEYITAFWTD